MPEIDLACRAIKKATVAALLAALALPLAARAETPRADCDAPLDMIRFANPLSRLSQKLNSGEPITIVAIGSSSTAGAGASIAGRDLSEPAAGRTQARFPGHADHRAQSRRQRRGSRATCSSASMPPWSPPSPTSCSGSSAPIRCCATIGSTDHGASIHAGLAKIRATGADIVLIDPQYAPKVIAKPEAAPMVELIAATAKREDVDLFPRFDVMKHWYDVDHMTFASFVSPDGLHMNDWSYGCLAKALSVAIAEAAQRPVMSATRATGAVTATAVRSQSRHGRACPHCCAHTFSSAVSRSSIRSSAVLEPGREPHQPVADAEFGALLRRQPLVRGRRRMRDQALGVAEIVGDADRAAAH